MRQAVIRMLALTPVAVFALLACCVALLFAQAAGPTKRLSLDEAKELAYKTNAGIKLGDLNVSAQTEAKEAQRKDYYPKVSGDYLYMRMTTLGDVLQAGPLGPVSLNVIGPNLSLFSVTAGQPITQLWTVKAAVEVAKANEDIAKAKLDGGTRDLYYAVTRLFYGLMGAQGMQSAAQLKVSVAEQESRTKNTPEAAVALLEAKESLSRANSQVALLSFELNGVVGFAPNTQLQLTAPPTPAPPVKSAEEAISQALANNPEIREAKHTVSKAAAGLRIAKLSYVPDVVMLGGYANLHGVDIFTQHNIGFIGVDVSWSFFEWGKKGRLKHEAELQHEMAQNAVELKEGEVAAAALKAYLNFSQAGDAVRLKKDILAQRKKADQSASDATTTTAVKKGELDLMKAELQYSLAHAELEKAISGGKK